MRLSKWVIWAVVGTMFTAWAVVFDHPPREWLIAITASGATLFAQWVSETVMTGATKPG